jgi:hypothetical protein
MKRLRLATVAMVIAREMEKRAVWSDMLIQPVFDVPNSDFRDEARKSLIMITFSDEIFQCHNIFHLKLVSAVLI